VQNFPQIIIALRLLDCHRAFFGRTSRS
jgi:hypothetical protein